MQLQVHLEHEQTVTFDGDDADALQRLAVEPIVGVCHSVFGSMSCDAA